MKQTQRGPQSNARATGIPTELIWRCTECKSLLGFLSRDKTVLRIKYKDLYIHIKQGDEGAVSRNCRVCGYWNTVGCDDAPVTKPEKKT
jgi:hypothetical protein